MQMDGYTVTVTQLKPDAPFRIMSLRAQPSKTKSNALELSGVICAGS